MDFEAYRQRGRETGERILTAAKAAADKAGVAAERLKSRRGGLPGPSWILQQNGTAT
jgi:hypothetical protein